MCCLHGMGGLFLACDIWGMCCFQVKSSFEGGSFHQVGM